MAAKKVADYIGTVHHEINYTIEEGLDAIRDVIYYIETYDVTTVRASTPMYLLARVIKSMGIKMVLSGEGADEVFGGYLYFHKAPDAKAFHEETVRKLSKQEYFYRTIFEEHFPSESAARSVPSIPSVACSTAEALAWDSAFKNMNDPSGRAVKGVHEAAY